MKSLYKDNKNLKNQSNFNFLTNNVKGLQSTKKRLELFNFLKDKIGPKVYSLFTGDSLFCRNRKEMD